MTKSYEPEDIAKVLPLISAWGTAIERGEDSEEPLNVLKKAFRSKPELVTDAVDFAYKYQGEMASQYHMHVNSGGAKPMPTAYRYYLAQFQEGLPENDPVHPLQRQDRVALLQSLLGIDMYPA